MMFVRFWNNLPKEWFNWLVGIATIASCVITYVGVNRGIQQVFNNLNQLSLDVKPVIEKYQSSRDTLMPRNLILIFRDTVVSVHKDTVYLQQDVSKYVTKEEMRRLTNLMDTWEKKYPDVFY